MNLQHLSDIHTRRHAQRVQHDVKRTPVRQERHVFHRKHTGYNTLVSVTACHLVADRYLPLLCYINSHGLIYARRQLVAVLPCKYFRVHNDTVLAMGNLERRVPYLTGLLSKNRAEKPLFCRKLRLPLRSNLSYQDVSGAHLCADPDDSSLVQIFQGIVSHTWNVAGNLLRPELGVTSLRLIFLNVDGCIHVVLYKALAQENGILIVVAFPRHKSDERILSESHLSVGSRRTVRNHVSCLHTVSLEDNGPLVITVALIAAKELCQLIFLSIAIILADNNLSRSRALNHAALFRHDAHAGVNGRFLFHTGTDNRSLRHKQGHRLTLHVRPHKRTVGIVILKERNQRRRHRKHHLRGNVHVIEHLPLVLLRLLPVTSGYVLTDKMPLLIQLLVGLSHMVIVFLVCRHIYDFIRDNRIHRIVMVYLPVRRLHKTVLVNPRIACERVDQSDVRTFRRLNRAHSSVVGVMHVADLESCTVSGKTSGAKSRQTTLMSQLAKRIVLIHELGEL